MRKTVTLYILACISLCMACQKEVLPSFDTFSDSRDGIIYKTVTIGSQTWLEENLKYLPEVSPSDEGSLESKLYYVYNYEGDDVEEAKESQNYKTYGVLYNFEAALSACPQGWHFPTEEDFKELRNEVGYWRAEDLRSISNWSSDRKGTNNSGFNALPSGNRENGAGFIHMGTGGSFWANLLTDDVPDRAYVWGFGDNKNVFSHNDAHMEEGNQIRCIKDN